MEINIIYSLIGIIICLIILLFYYWELVNIYVNDVSYHLYFIKNHFKNTNDTDSSRPTMTNLNNKYIRNKYIPKILFVTFDNRPNLKYVKMHNKNINDYAKKWNYEYIFIDKCDYNVYWCKLYIVLKYLNSENYDYVVWLDSDTVINNYDICFGDILTNYDKDIFIGDDNHPLFYLTNAGVFVIRNTNIGKQFLIDCIKNFYSNCLTKDGKLNGIWAGTCYEQGTMNLIIAKKYSNNTFILPKNIIYNKDICRHDVFILHMYNSSEPDREKCFLNTLLNDTTQKYN